MSILLKPYEISVWQDIWQGDKFCEQRLGVIGTNEMLYQGRAIEPNLVRNVNGTKQFSFKMYKHFVDTVTGEKVDNPFIDWLISERKVKLKYEKDENGNDIWYDFVIKDITENSSNYLYTYQLEDALVQELSKNGFGVTLDEQLRNNMGNVEYLATETLKETDWKVESEVFVERVDEALVYVQLPESLSNDSKVYKLLDNGDDFLKTGLQTEEDSSVLGKTVLAFYSSCRNKPHRFQFIYLPNYDKSNVSIDKNRQILNKNCQYYIEFEPNKYTVTNADYGFILPTGFSIVNKTYEDGSAIVNASDSTISTWYRGGRYGFAQKAEYIPLLDRYCQVYSSPSYDSTSKTGNSNIYYGYVDNKYEDLVFNTNLVENTEFSNTSGWTGTYTSSGTSADKAVIENVYGKFINNSFISTTDVLAGTATTGKTFEEFLNDPDNKCAPYLKVELKSDKSLVINSGPYHNRTIIKNMPVGSKWALRAEYITNSSGTLGFDIDEYIYDTSNGHYSALATKKIDFDIDYQDNYVIYTVKKNTFADEKDFTKNCKLKIAISGIGTYYIKNLEFFRARFDKDGKVIPLENQSKDIENLITTQYRYFKPSELNDATEAKDIHYDYETDTLSYETYKPVYNANGEKIRAVSAKESNYFNILQSIAETFECWLDLQIVRDDPTQPGAITRKIAKFKNYVGGDNYACFRYGVNLKDIQRTYSSKNIVTKLMVKQNSNEYGENGMCTIARAGANPTGDTSIYDFSYFQNMGLMNAHDYIDTMYKIDGAEGPDIGNSSSYNIQGYFPRIRAINDQLFDKIDQEVVLKQQLLKLNSDLEVQKAKQSAAASGIEEASDSYFQMTGVRPTELVNGKIDVAAITLDTENKYNASNEEKKGHLSYYESDSEPGYILNIPEITDNKITITAIPSGGAATFQKTKTLSIAAYPILTTQNGSKFVQTLYFTLEIEKDKASANSQEQAPDMKTVVSQAKKYFDEYATYAAQKHEADIKVPELQNSIDELQTTYNDLTDTIQKLKNYKIALNQLFFTRYSRFIQEGTWIDEKYYDDEKYYNDALSVMYNSCYPQVAYTINTFEVSQLPGYEMFNFNVGEKTWVEDGEFFGFNADGSPQKEEVIITEKSENLDDPSKNTNKVQNFKNQFQDLFQKITATVQQAQYSTGAYEKGVAEANAIAEDSVGFLREAMSDMTMNLDNPQVMSESTDKSSQLRIVDGKILIGKRDQNTEEISWTTGLSSDGIAADLINTGQLNTVEIQIYSGDNPTFRWDSKGISAYDYTNFNNVISGVNTNKFVRFDKYGIYGIDGGVNADWVPGQISGKTPLEEIDSKATFALTWEGLKVTGNEGVIARIGKYGDNIVNITDEKGYSIFKVNTDGSSEIAGWTVSGQTGYNGGFYHDVQSRGSRTHRFGLKIENGDDERYAFYVKKFNGSEITGGQPLGQLVFGVRYNGEVIATAGEIAGWGISENGFVKKQGDEVVHAIYAQGNASNKISVILYNPDGTEAYNQSEKILMQLGKKLPTNNIALPQQTQSITLRTTEQGPVTWLFEIPLSSYPGGHISSISISGYVGYDNAGNNYKIDTLTLELQKNQTTTLNNIYAKARHYEGSQWWTTPVQCSITWDSDNNLLLFQCIGNNDGYDYMFEFGVHSLEVVQTMSYFSFVVSEKGTLSLSRILATSGQLGQFKIFSDGSIGYNASTYSGNTNYNRNVNLSKNRISLFSKNANAGQTVEMDFDGFKVYTGQKNASAFISAYDGYYTTKLSEREVSTEWWGNGDGSINLSGGYRCYLQPSGIYWSKTSGTSSNDWPYGSLYTAEAYIKTVRYGSEDANKLNNIKDLELCIGNTKASLLKLASLMAEHPYGDDVYFCTDWFNPSGAPYDYYCRGVFGASGAHIYAYKGTPKPGRMEIGKLEA